VQTAIVVFSAGLGLAIVAAALLVGRRRPQEIDADIVK